MRIVLAADGSRGDVHPLLDLGDRLRAAGHEAVLCAPPDFAGEAAARGLEFHATGRSVRDFLVARADAMTGSAVRQLREASSYLREVAAAHFAVLVEVARGCDRVVGASVQLAASSAAELHGVPYRFLAYCPVLFPSAEHPSFLVARQSLPRWLNRLSWRLTLPLIEHTILGLVNRERARLGLAPVRDAYRHLFTAEPILAADRALAPAPPDAPPGLRQVPCLHAMRAEPLPHKLEAFLAQGPPPVYVGFGSMPDADPNATTRLVLEAAASVGCRLVVGGGWASLGRGPLREDVAAVDVVSHAALFPRCAAVVHHGGAGTTTSAARAGVPQIAVPHVADQSYWGERVRRLGLGPPPIPRRRLTARGLAEALRDTLDNEVLAERARGLGERLRGEAEEIDPIAVFLD